MLRSPSRSCVFTILLAAVLPARGAELELVSFLPGRVHDLGAQYSVPRAITPDGRFVLLESVAPNLLPGPLPARGCQDLFLHDRATGTKRRATTPVGAPPLASGGRIRDGVWQVLSDDGQVLIFAAAFFEYCPFGSGDDFWSLADFRTGTVATFADLLPPVPGVPPSSAIVARALSGDGNHVGVTVGDQLVLYDRSAGTATLVSHAAGDSSVAGTGESGGPVLSRDGRFVLYASSARNLVAGYDSPGPSYQVYLFDATTGVNRLVSAAVGTTDRGSNSSSLAVALAENGTVFFSSMATNLAPGQQDTFQSTDLFAFDEAHGVRLISHAPGTPANALGSDARMRGVDTTGRFVLFETLGMAVAGTDHNPGYDLFLYDLQAGTAVLVSHRLGTTNETANVYSQAVALSADGQTVYLLSSATDLTADAVGNTLFRFDRGTGQVTTLLANSNASGILAREAPVLAIASPQHDLALPLVDALPYADSFALDTSTGILETLSAAAAPVHVSTDWDSYSVVISADGGTLAYVSTTPYLVHSPPYLLLGKYAIAFDRLAKRNEFLAHTPGNPQEGREGAPAALSADGRYAVIASGDPLVAGQSGASQGTKVYFYDRHNHQATLVSHLAGQPLIAGVGLPVALSADGRFVLWSSNGNGFVPGVTSTHWQLYLWDREQQVHRLVSRGLGSPLEAGDGDSLFVESDGKVAGPEPQISIDGRRVLFVSKAANLAPGDAGTSVDLFVFDAVDGALRRVSHPPGKPDSFLVDPVNSARMAAAGRFVAFGTSPPPGSVFRGSVYRWDAVTGDSEVVFSSANHWAGVSDLSPDGRRLLFETRDPVVIPGIEDDNLEEDLYLEDFSSGNRTLVTHRFDSPGKAAGGFRGRFAGGRVVFQSYRAARLVQGGTSHGLNLFDYDFATHRAELITHEFDLPLVGASTAFRQDFSFAASTDGSVVAFSSAASRLHPYDLNRSLWTDFPTIFDSGADVFLYRPAALFTDGFESGNLAAWSVIEP